MSTAIQEEINRKVAALPENAQRHILDIVNQLSGSRPAGISGEEYARHISGLFSEDDAAEMLNAIEEDCERIDYERW